MVDPKMFRHENKQPEGFNVFLWYDEPVQGTKMEILKADKTVDEYNLSKNSIFLINIDSDRAGTKRIE